MIYSAFYSLPYDYKRVKNEKMDKAELKKGMDELLAELPEEANWKDVMYKIYVRQSIEQGLKDVEEGRVI